MPLGFLTRAVKRKAEETVEPPKLVRTPQPVAIQSNSTRTIPVPRPRKRAKYHYNNRTAAGTRASSPIVLSDDSDPAEKAGGSGQVASAPAVIKTESDPVDGGETSDGVTAVGEESQSQSQTVVAASADDEIQPEMVTVVDAGTQVSPWMLEPLPPPRVYTYDAKYNFKDGDIVLRVKSTLFRVHRLRLADVEGLFGQLLFLPQPDDCEKIDGQGVCDLYNLVTPRELHFLLAVIYGDL
jgi:hypothetical protein